MASIQTSTQRQKLQDIWKTKCLLPLTEPGLSVSITLLEQAIFVNASLDTPSVLRGCVELCASKYVQIRDLVIKFRGENKIRTFGVFNDEECIVDHAWSIPQLESQDGAVIQPYWTAGHRRWPVLKPGLYVYDFELTIDKPLPETFNVSGCRLNYHIQAIARLPSLRRKVSQSQEVTVVHRPRDEFYLHGANQVSLSRMWNRRILYSVELADKSAAIGGNVPIAVRIGCSDILYITMQVYLGQKIKFPGVPGRQAQLCKKLLLKSKCSDVSTGKFNENMPPLNLDRESDTLVIAGSLPLRDEPKTQLKLHPDVDFTKVKATHTLLFLIDITIPNANDTQKTTICRLTAEVPFCIRSPYTQLYDISVPQYTETQDLSIDSSEFRNSRLLSPPFPFLPIFSDQSSYTSSTDSTENLELSSETPSTCILFSSESTDETNDKIPLSPPPAYDSILGTS